MTKVGGELTLGRPDHKEGLYFGTEMTWEEAKTKPMHGPNLWPEKVPALKETVPHCLPHLFFLFFSFAFSFFLFWTKTCFSYRRHGLGFRVLGFSGFRSRVSGLGFRG